MLISISREIFILLFSVDERRKKKQNGKKDDTGCLGRISKTCFVGIFPVGFDVSVLNGKYIFPPHLENKNIEEPITR